MLLKCSNLNIHYGQLQAVIDASFSVKKGEIVAVVGANGAGKTTLLKSISGLITSTSGEVEYNGQKIDDLEAHEIVELGLSFVPEGRELFPFMTVLENLRLGAYSERARQQDFDENIERVYQHFPRLKEREKQWAKTLSGGEQQMLAIGRALMSNPDLLMLDEPSLGLAPNLVLLVFDVVKDLNDNGTTILLIEQNVLHSLELADRGYVLETGRITLEGDSEELINNEYLRKACLGM
jgi:branched-chain amino acid transport system ATP-binding protein